MTRLDLDASGWGTVTDFYDALLALLQAPDWHGQNIDALIDSVIVGNINGIAPPYQITVRRLGLADAAARAALFEAFGFLSQEGAVLTADRQRVTLCVSGAH